MDAEKYNRQLTLLCPTCGGSQFEHEIDTANIEIVKCASCERTLTRDELIRENSENISEHAAEIGREFSNDVTKELKRALRGIKNLRVR